MNWSPLRALFLLTVFAIPYVSLFCENATSDIESMRVENIIIEIGADSKSQQAVSIRARMKTKEGSLFSQADFDEDLKTLVQEFDRIEPEVSKTDGKIKIVLKVHPKPYIKEIRWEGNKEETKSKLQKELGIKPGMVFDRQTFNKAFNKLKTYYIKHGFFEAELNYTLERDPKKNDIIVSIKIKEGQSGKIEKIAIRNVSKKERNEILDLIFTKKYNMFTSWLTNEGTLNPEIMRHDELTIVNYLHNKGYAEAKVKVLTKPSKKSNRIIVVVDIDRGKEYHFGTISIENNNLFSKEKIFSKIPFKDGDTYSPEAVREAVKAIYDLYGSKGYIDAVITPESTLHPEKRIYDLTFKITENERFRVGLIKVFGNQQTNTSVVLHECLLVPGDVFDSTMIQHTEERLLNMGYFKNVNVYAVKTTRGQDAKVSFRDVHIEVEENPTTAHFSAGVGFSTTESVSFSLGFNENNFNSKGFASLFTRGIKSLRGGGEYLGINATIGKKMLVYSLSWTKPYFMDTQWSVGFDVKKSRNSYSASDYTVKSNSLQLFAFRSLNSFVRFNSTYRLTHSFIDLKHVSHAKRNRELIRESKNGGLISAIGGSLTYDSTDNFMRPTRGVKSDLSAEFAGVGGDHSFFNFGYHNTFFWSPYQFGIFRLRGNLQFIKTVFGTKPKHIPMDERLYLGGEKMMRGYKYNYLGPKFHDKDHTPRGGMSEIFGSIDYDQYIFKKLDGFVFFDAGSVAFREFSIAKLRYTTGYGVKIKLMENAPIAIGMGYPLNPQSKRDVKRFFITFSTAF